MKKRIRGKTLDKALRFTSPLQIALSERNVGKGREGVSMRGQRDYFMLRS